MSAAPSLPLSRTLLHDSHPRSRTWIRSGSTSLPAGIEFGEHRESLHARGGRPASDLIERAETPFAVAGVAVHAANVVAGRRHFLNALDQHRTRFRHAARLAANALATFDAGSRPSAPQMNRPASKTRARSTPVSPPRPSSI